jgi:hypothetical protein
VYQPPVSIDPFGDLPIVCAKLSMKLVVRTALAERGKEGDSTCYLGGEKNRIEVEEISVNSQQTYLYCGLAMEIRES